MVADNTELNLNRILKGKVIFLCMGNLECGDDGVGPRLASALKGKVDYEVIDAGTVPENYTGVIRKLRPDVVIVVDAVRFEGPAGSVKLFRSEDLRYGRISTHNMSPGLFIEYLRSVTDAQIYILGVNPGPAGFGKGPCVEVGKAISKITSYVKKAGEHTLSVQ